MARTPRSNLTADVLQRIVDDPEAWYRCVYKTPCFPWQIEVASAVERLIDDTRARRVQPGLECALLVARQGGKNETTARLETRLLVKFQRIGGAIVKAAPTSKPQLHMNKVRLKEVAANPLTAKAIQWEEGYIARLGNAHVDFLSAEPSANRVGHTAQLLLEVDETQDVIKDIYNRDFRPMCATTGAPALLCGTVWDLETLLEEKRELCRERQKKVGRQLLWEYDWQRVAEQRLLFGDPTYRDFVLGEIDTLGETHPIILTQYRLIPVAALGRLVSDQDLVGMRGAYPRYFEPRQGCAYVAGVDLCGAAEQDMKEAILNVNASLKRDSTVVTIAEMRWRLTTNGRKIPILRIVDHLYLPNLHPNDCADRIHQYVFDRWRCQYAVVDASGVGDNVAAMLAARRPEQVTPLKSNLSVASSLGFSLLGAIQTGRLQCYQDDGSDAAEQFWHQFRHCRRELRPGGYMKFAAPTTKTYLQSAGRNVDIHDDFVKSAAYCLRAAEQHLTSFTDPSWFTSPDSFEWHDGGGFE